MCTCHVPIGFCCMKCIYSLKSDYLHHKTLSHEAHDCWAQTTRGYCFKSPNEVSVKQTSVQDGLANITYFLLQVHLNMGCHPILMHLKHSLPIAHSK